MLHMAVVTHGPDTCPIGSPEATEKAMAALGQMGEVAGKLGITMQGSWTNMPAHTLWFMLDAPNAHVVNQLMIELKLQEWNTIMVHPVSTLREAVEEIKSR